MLLKALTIALAALVLTGNVAAQEPERLCGDFNYAGQEAKQHVSAADILADLRSCNVHVAYAIVDGDVILERAVIGHELIFSAVDLLGRVDFSDATFQFDAGFVDTTFEVKADFQDATFQGWAGFSNADFRNEVNFLGADFQSGANFFGAKFKGRAGFTGTEFKGRADFEHTNFEGEAGFGATFFWEDARFRDATFVEDARFFLTTFEGTTDFRNALFNDRIHFSPDIRINSTIWSPTSGIINTNLTWSQVKGTFPAEENPIDMYGRWEHFFALANKASEARKVRTSQRRYELRFWVWSVGGGLGASWVFFTALYYWRFRRYRRGSRLGHTWKMLLFSLDVISPSIRPWKYDWHEDGRLPVRQVVVITAFESAIGWILLGVGSAILVAWLVA